MTSGHVPTPQVWFQIYTYTEGLLYLTTVITSHCYYTACLGGWMSGLCQCGSQPTGKNRGQLSQKILPHTVICLKPQFIANILQCSYFTLSTCCVTVY